MMHTLSHRFRYMIILCMIMTATACESDDDVSPDINGIMLDKINSIRVAGCMCGGVHYAPAQELTLNTKLSEVAYAHAVDMHERNYFSHLSPEGVSPEERATAAGYPGSLLAENIAEGYTTVDETLSAWLNSTSHCEALMTSDASEMGIAHVDAYWVLELGKDN